MTEKLKMHSINKIDEMFPNCVTERKCVIYRNRLMQTYWQTKDAKA